LKLNNKIKKEQLKFNTIISMWYLILNLQTNSKWNKYKIIIEVNPACLIEIKQKNWKKTKIIQKIFQ
jgi:hypothetical protein